MPSSTVTYIALALKAMLAMVAFGATGVAVVSFTNGYNFGSAGTPFPAVVQFQEVHLRSDVRTAPCHTSQQPWDVQPSRTLPLKISYASPNHHSQPTPTPPPIIREATSAPTSSFLSGVIAPAHAASTLAASSTWYHNLVQYLAHFVFALASSAPWVIIWKIIGLLSLMATPAYLIPRPDSFQRCLQLPTKTKAILGKVIATTLISFHKPGILLPGGMYKPRMNRTPNLEFRRPRKAHADIPEALCEQCLFTTADIGPSFGPSIQNAETEFRSRLERVEGNISKQADIVAFFRKTLDSFTRALVVAEATPKGRNTRYLTVIEDQDRLIEELRMLHEYREQAFQRNEDMIQFLCHADKDGFLALLEGKKEKRPVLKYSAEYDKFLISPLDDPATLSMKVSVQSAPFHRRPVSILDSDPHWQRFLESTAEKGSEQEARLVSHEDDLNKWDEKDWEDVDSGDDKEGDDVNECAGKELEDVQAGCVPGTCDVSDDKKHDENEAADDIRVNDAESPNEELEIAKSNLAWFEWKLDCMKGIPRDSNLQKSSEIPPSVKVMNDIAETRWLQEQSWAELPKQLAIRDCKLSIEMLEVEIACMEGKATSEGPTSEGKKGEILPEPTTA